ncbi:hypothetical protein [Thalassococcus sp. S3]|uniref:hypothetical protein n=1 Tax=Thalassococcus sp. S3 TaxID=2017482 RepID=UPI001024418B|nr:hypothetical protein [Thalassococcus sp. S3]QBF32128.1 hypothetical protein CFI11_12990 [Thalassococcus sp. S3]
MGKWSYTIAVSQDLPLLGQGFVVAETAAQAVKSVGNTDVNVYPLPDDVGLAEGCGPIYPTLSY